MKKNKLIMAGSLCLILCLAAGCGNRAKFSEGNVNNVNDVLQQQINAQNETSETGAQSESETKPQNTETSPSQEAAGVDLDLTLFSDTLLYTKVNNMITRPKKYLGTTVRVSGSFAAAYSEEKGKQYFACLVTDRTACCTAALEFELKGTHSYPEDYPEINDEITVQGTFDAYEEDGLTYGVLRNATLERSSS